MSGPAKTLTTEVGRPRLPALDGLRGLAVLLVILSHAANVGLLPVPFLNLAGCGRAGVFLFFVLSAFLLTDQFLDLAPRQLLSRDTWLRYSGRRFLRIYPAFLGCALLYRGLEGWSPDQLVGHLLMVRGEDHLWTVPVEMRYYLLLPLVVLAITPLRRAPAGQLLLLIAAAALLRWFVAPDYGVLPPDFRVRLLPFVPVFLAGSAAAVLHRVVRGWNEGAGPGVSARRGFDLLALVAGLVLLLHVPALWAALEQAPIRTHRFHMRFDLLGALWSALLLGLLLGSGGARRPFEWRPLRWVGWVSYSAYLLHKLVLEQAARHLTVLAPTLVFWIFLAATLLVAWISWQMLERPFSGLWARTRPGGARNGSHA